MANKSSAWSESQYKRSKVNGTPDCWRKAAEALYKPTDLERVRLLLGQIKKNNGKK